MYSTFVASCILFFRAVAKEILVALAALGRFRCPRPVEMGPMTREPSSCCFATFHFSSLSCHDGSGFLELSVRWLNRFRAAYARDRSHHRSGFGRIKALCDAVGAGGGPVGILCLLLRGEFSFLRLCHTNSSQEQTLLPLPTQSRAFSIQQATTRRP